MQKVEELIEKLADHIIGIIDANDGATYTNEIAGEVRALAELISARAYMNWFSLAFSPDKRITELEKMKGALKRW